MVKLREGEGAKRPCCLRLSVFQNPWRPKHRVSITTPFQLGNSSQEHPFWPCLAVCLCENCYTWTCVPWVCRLCTLDKIFFWWPARVTPILTNSLQENKETFRHTYKKQKRSTFPTFQAAGASGLRFFYKSFSIISNDTQVYCNMSFADSVGILSA